MSDVEKAISGNICDGDTYDTKHSLCTGGSRRQYNQNQKKHTQQMHTHTHTHTQHYSFQPTITTNTHYCHETGHIKTSATTPSHSPSTSSSSRTSSSTGLGCTRQHQAHNCFSLLLKIIFSTPGLVALVVAYSIIGALLFPLLEAPQDLTKSAAIAKSREDCLRELWIITEKLNVLYERNWTMLVHEQLRRFEGSIVAATRQGSNSISGRGFGVAVRGGNNNIGTAVGRFGGNLDLLDESARWSFSEALLYSVTVITTIGHGSLTPKTAAGKIATILYALIGVPLMLMCLSSLGSLLADALHCTYTRICCRLTSSTSTSTSTTATATSTPTSTPTANKQRRRQQQQQQQQQPQQHYKQNSKAMHNMKRNNNGRGGITMGNKRQHCYDEEEPCMGELPTVKQSPEERNDDGVVCGCQDQVEEMDSKCCKHETITTEMKPNAGTTITNRNDDSYHLLDQTAARLNNNGTCMQLSPQQQQQQQQQFYQQQGLDATQSATPSPQRRSYHTLRHPLQTIHILTAAPTVPATATTIAHYATLQNRQWQRQQQMQQRQQQQRFVAVPSGLLRFSTPSPTGMQATATSICLRDADTLAQTTVSHQAITPATATIYFPIVSSTTSTAMPPPTIPAVTFMATTASSQHTSGIPVSVVSMANNAQQQQQQQQHQQQQQQLPYTQPFVKYQTIQLQPKKPYIVASSISPTATNTIATLDNSITTAIMSLPPPPPPAYQTATVHGVRRAKFLAKPVTQEINTLLAESDIDIACGYDLLQSAATAATDSQHLSVDAAVEVPTTLTATTTNATTAAISETEGPTSIQQPSILDSSTTVEIMDDEEENEQSRLGNCPHGTPSRIPLISTSVNYTDDRAVELGKAATQRGGSSLINSTAASFHRHTLHTFQRNGNNVAHNRKGLALVNRRNGASLTRNRDRRVNRIRSCYGDLTDTSDDEDYMQQHGNANEQFVLAQIEPCSTSEQKMNNEFNIDDTNMGIVNDTIVDESDAAGIEELDDSLNNGCNDRNVPISLVLLILICYISLGTVIFAFWENWSLIDGAYFCFVTLATIGYGDFMPERTFNGPDVQLFACCAYLLLGLVLVAMSFSILETQLMWKCKLIAVRLKLTKD